MHAVVCVGSSLLLAYFVQETSLRSRCREIYCSRCRANTDGAMWVAPENVDSQELDLGVDSYYFEGIDL